MNHFADEGMAETGLSGRDPEWAGEGYGETLLRHVKPRPGH